MLGFFVLISPLIKKSDQAVQPEIIHDRRLLKIIDILGRETKPTINTSLFYIYDDGTVEKKLIIE